MTFQDFDTTKPFLMTGGDYTFRLPYPAEISLTAATGTVRIKTMNTERKPDNPPVQNILDILDLVKDASTLLRQAALQLDANATVTYGVQNKIKTKAQEIEGLMLEIQTTFVSQFVKYAREQRERS